MRERERERDAREIIKNGCLNCHSKNLELKIWLDARGGYNYLHFITDECPKCRLTKVIDTPNWEEIKPIVIKNTGIKSKKEFIKEMNKRTEGAYCYCSLVGFNWKSPWVIGGGLVGLGLIIGLIVYFSRRKKKA